MYNYRNLKWNCVNVTKYDSCNIRRKYLFNHLQTAGCDWMLQLLLGFVVAAEDPMKNRGI